jgi:hypothetical protein
LLVKTAAVNAVLDLAVFQCALFALKEAFKKV